MKKIRENLDRWSGQLQERWQALPVGAQRRYTLYFFTGYLLLTAVAIFEVWHDTANTGNGMAIEHIENPVPKNKKSPASPQDTSSTILKNNSHERK
ncbi:nitrogen regulatory IIA protein [Pedobacter sp. ASV28]|uniref:nitrogen regulatory IIA protein n=1 Tax=Pedobacter sp. ASV28 TaxID=2795123 RepID=UPI0018ED4766|nr:nitrogen regulatory IIA protein [Pedobacter sp. ASV28]